MVAFNSDGDFGTRHIESLYKHPCVAGIIQVGMGDYNNY